jgi:Beta-lactamase
MRERFLFRLGMQSSFARPARFADWNGIRTVGYRWRDGSWQLHDSVDGEAFLGGSNLYFSAADLARWGTAIAGGTALPRAVFEAGQHPFTVAGLPLQVTGLSWYCDDRKVRCNYSGHHAGFHGFVFWDRERNESVAFISNSTLPAWKIACLQRDLVNALAGHPPDRDPPATFIEVYKTDPAEFTGTYGATGVPTVTLSAVQGAIKMQMGNGPPFDAYPAARQVLYVPGLDAYLAFSGTKTTRTLHLKSQELNIVARRS